MNNRQFYKAVDSTRRLNMITGITVELSRDVEELMGQIEGGLAAERVVKENIRALTLVRHLIGDRNGEIADELKVQKGELNRLHSFLNEHFVFVESITA